MDGTIGFGGEAFSCARWSLIRRPFRLHPFPLHEMPVSATSRRLAARSLWKNF